MSKWINTESCQFPFPSFLVCRMIANNLADCEYWVCVRVNSKLCTRFITLWIRFFENAKMLIQKTRKKQFFLSTMQRGGRHRETSYNKRTIKTIKYKSRNNDGHTHTHTRTLNLQMTFIVIFLLINTQYMQSLSLIEYNIYIYQSRSRDRVQCTHSQRAINANRWNYDCRRRRNKRKTWSRMKLHDLLLIFFSFPLPFHARLEIRFSAFVAQNGVFNFSLPSICVYVSSDPKWKRTIQ